MLYDGWVLVLLAVWTVAVLLLWWDAMRLYRRARRACDRALALLEKEADR